jgi:hypothetical protein
MDNISQAPTNLNDAASTKQETGKLRQPPTNVAIRTEQETGKRFCIKCDKLLPLEQFKTNKRKYLCITHLRAMKKHYALGTHEKRAFNSLRCRARTDMLMFGMSRMVMGQKQVKTMLTPEQMTNFSKYCLIPKRPDQPLTEGNSIIVTSVQRTYVVGNWRSTRDADQYERDLHYILSAPVEPGHALPAQESLTQGQLADPAVGPELVQA